MTTAADLFAGMGGFTEGATQAGIKVLVAANHWPAAVECHAANHPDTEHVCQDLRQANFYDWPGFDLLLASPSCTGHSNARGKNKPKHQGDRSTAWAVIDCAEAKQPAIVVVENVKEWATRWVLFPAWRLAMQALGYSVAPHVINSADYGVPQSRPRLVAICTRSLRPFQLRDRRGSHHVAAASFIDWNAGEWCDTGSLVSPGAIARVASGRRLYGERFIHSYYGSERHARSIDLPVRTLTTKDRHAIVDGRRQRMLNEQECRAAMGFRADYQLPAESTLAKHMLGNAVCPPMIAGVLGELLEAA